MNRYLWILGLLLPLTSIADTWFVSPGGNDAASGDKYQYPLRTISRAMMLTRPGDTVALLPGIYMGRNMLIDKHGNVDLPITIRSYSTDPLQYAVIDGKGTPALDSDHEGFVLSNCSWINLEHLIFRNCWTHVIQLYDSPYISVRGCHFSTGKRVIHAVGHGTHHTLVEHCYVKHPDPVWRGWSWESLHHGEVSYYNGALLHPAESGGGHIMRYNSIINMFNAFRTRPVSMAEDGNTEIYGNTMINIRDNEFEPESFAWNMHYHHNDHVNVHKMYSIDGVEGGNIYIYGNTYTQGNDPWALEEVSGIFKYKNGPLTFPCYAFNNSYYTEAKVLRWGESTNHHLKHFNNAYEFFQGQDNFQLTEWQPGYEFDYDCLNQDWPGVIDSHWQELHGLEGTDPGFIDGATGDFRLSKHSPCRDAGKVMQLPEFDWIQDFRGTAPDIGAYEDQERIQGPAFRFMPSPEGALYQERPRISKIRTRDHRLDLFFTVALDTSTFTNQTVKVLQKGRMMNIVDIDFSSHEHQVQLTVDKHVDTEAVSLVWLQRPVGLNGLPVTDWGSAIDIGVAPREWQDLAIVPVPVQSSHEIPDFAQVNLVVDPAHVDVPMTFRIIFDSLPALKYINHISIYGKGSGEITAVYEPLIFDNEVRFQHPEKPLPPGAYIAKTRVGTRIIETAFNVP